MIDEKKVLAEILGLHVYANTLLELHDSPRDKLHLCTACFLYDKGCSIPPDPSTRAAVFVCGGSGVFKPWEPKP